MARAASPQALEEAARQVEQDRFAQETYIDSEAYKLSGAKAAVTRRSLEHAMGRLNARRSAFVQRPDQRRTDRDRPRRRQAP